MRTSRTTLTGLRLTAADCITVTRAVLGACCGLLILLGLLGWQPQRGWLLFALAAIAVLLDLVDGEVARRTNTVTERGARWDPEVDAAVLAVLCLAVAPQAPWVLLIGAARYLFLVGGWFRPAWRGRLAPSLSRRFIGGLQGWAMVIALAPALPLLAGLLITALALLLLVYSFGRDILALERAAQP